MRIFGKSSEGVYTAFRMLGDMQEDLQEWVSAAILFILVPGGLLQTGGLHFCRLSREERLQLALVLARLMHRTSEVSLQPAMGSGTMAGYTCIWAESQTFKLWVYACFVGLWGPCAAAWSWLSLVSASNHLTITPCLRCWARSPCRCGQWVGVTGSKWCGSFPWLHCAWTL